MFSGCQEIQFPQQFLGAINVWQPRQMGLLLGSSKVFPLSMLWQVELVKKGFLVHNIDCAMCFNSYQIANQLLRNSIPPESFDSHITLVRAFTPYQILDAVKNILTEVDISNPKVFFILAPTKQFFDGDVQLDEAVFLLDKFFNIINDYRKKGISLIIVERDSYSSTMFPIIINKIKKIAKPLWQLHYNKSKEKETRWEEQLQLIQ